MATRGTSVLGQPFAFFFLSFSGVFFVARFRSTHLVWWTPLRRPAVDLHVFQRHGSASAPSTTTTCACVFGSFLLVRSPDAQRMVVFPALSSPSTRILASRSPNSEYSFDNQSPMATFETTMELHASVVPRSRRPRPILNGRRRGIVSERGDVLNGRWKPLLQRPRRIIVVFLRPLRRSVRKGWLALHPTRRRSKRSTLSC